MVVEMSCNEKWYYYLVVNLYSLLKSNKKIRKVYLIVETENIDSIKYLRKVKEKFNVELVLMNFNNHYKKYIKDNCPNTNTVYTNFSFSKLMLADFIEEDYALYIDTDAIVIKDISHLRDYDIEKYYAIGCKDYGTRFGEHLTDLEFSDNYINSGFVLFNLKLIRQDNIIKKWFDFINSQKLKYPDQDALNYICGNKELYIPSFYNCANNVTQEVLNRKLIKVYHYTGLKKPWIVDKYNAEIWYTTEEEFYNELNLTDKISII